MNWLGEERHASSLHGLPRDVVHLPYLRELPVHSVPASGALMKLNTVLRVFPIECPNFYLPEVDLSN